MDGNGSLNLRNWGFLEPPNSTLKSYLGLQLMTSMTDEPLFGGSGGGVHEHTQAHPSSLMASTNGGPFHHLHIGGISESHIPMDYWNREKYFNILSANRHHGYYQPNYNVSPMTLSEARSIPIPQQIVLPENENVVSQKEDIRDESDNNSNGRAGGSGSGGRLPKKRNGGILPKSPPKEKKPRTRTPRTPKEESTILPHRAKAPKKPAEVVINGINMDISGIPIPICTCTGTPQQCYRWGSGGWQSACCTTNLSTYPLPMSTKRCGVRIAGRKMSIGAFTKVLEKLASEGYDFSDPIDLRRYWAKHGTNKFVTIR